MIAVSAWLGWLVLWCVPLTLADPSWDCSELDVVSVINAPRSPDPAPVRLKYLSQVQPDPATS